MTFMFELSIHCFISNKCFHYLGPDFARSLLNFMTERLRSRTTDWLWHNYSAQNWRYSRPNTWVSLFVYVSFLRTLDNLHEGALFRFLIFLFLLLHYIARKSVLMHIYPFQFEVFIHKTNVFCWLQFHHFH